MVNSNNNTHITSSEPVNDIRKMVYASLFAALTAIGAYITIPLGPIPFTLQVVFVLLAGGMLGSKWGSISMIVYTLLGIAGLPVFSGGASGLGVILGPTGGYIIGFIAAAFVVGFLFEKKRSEKVLINAVYVLMGSVVIYAFGLTHLMVVADMSFMQAITVGFLPFIGGALVKVAVAAYIATSYRI
ncbi:MAG: biotin transporter BioY [Methanosarcinales archaeon]|nr:biotin transporter BioY [Methanosarcinales archaeon]